MPSAPSILPSRETFIPVISLRMSVSSSRWQALGVFLLQAEPAVPEGARLGGAAARGQGLGVFLLRAEPAVPEGARLGAAHARGQDVEVHVPARADHQHGA